MKRLFSYFLVLAALAAWPVFSFAATDLGNTFHADVQLNNDASADITETINVNFSDQRHGIYRVLPYRYRDTHDHTITVPIELASVLRNGSAEPFSQTKEGDDVRVKIGSSDSTVTGAQAYTITYRVDAVVNFLDSTDEFYWNVSGNDWEWSWDSVTATVLPPPSQTLTPSSVVCYTGDAGSTTHDCTISASTSGVAVAAAEPLTVVAQFPKGAITKPANYDALRKGAIPFISRYFVALMVVNAMVALLGFFGLFAWWWKHGRDPKGKAVTIAQYDPPDKASPGEVGVLMDERADMTDVSASIVNLAVNGYLIIHETKEKKLLSTATSYTFERTTKQIPDTLPSHERALLDGLFASGTNVELKDLRTKFFTTLKDVKKKLYAEVTDRGYFGGNPERVRMKYLGVGIALLVVFAIVPGVFVFTWGIAAIGVMVIAFSWTLPRRTPTGVEALWHARGFKLFLEAAEKYRLKWQEKENIFELYLPYAMVYGVADKWAKAFAGLNQKPPAWYDGSSLNNFSTIALWSSLNSATNTIATSLATRPGGAAGGGSGFSGGFSGGGFGGGGGGSW